MKLTPRAQGCRFRRRDWPEGKYIDINRVGSGRIKTVQGTNEEGLRVTFFTSELETDWIKIPGRVRDGNALPIDYQP